jgi:iron complex outermembrane receptor protein
MQQITFSKKRLAATISLLLTTGVAAPIYAQETDEAAGDVEVIQVKGIRGSLARSMDLKREGTGVVDAISAEDMGKFPDTNLAESLQRITGVTVSRSNGEGSQITVRGFGPEFNLVTLNGRQMPGTGNSRSYNLEDLSSAGVSALEVFKTARAETPSGGLGATVNIVTTKPLNSPGLKYSIMGKGIVDSSTEVGDDITPEVAALYSNTFADNTIGVAFSISSQRRDFQQQSANVPGWQANQSAGAATGDDAIDLRPEDADGNKLGTTFFPRQISYNINDSQRSRLNGQLTLQYAPTDDMTFTLDYVKTEAETATQGLGFGIWFNFGNNITAYELDERGTAVRFTETANDYAHSANVGTTLVKARSVGFNWEWQFNDDFHFELDYHDSSNGVDTGADKGSRHTGNVILAPNNIVDKTYDYTSGEVPNYSITWPGGAADANPNDFDPLFAQISTSAGESTVEQVQFHSEWVNPDDSFLTNVKFGLASTEQTIGGFGAGNGNQGPNGYNGNQAIFPDSMFTRQSTGDFLDALDGGGSALTTNYFYSFDYAEVIARMAANFEGFSTDPLDALDGRTEALVTEETSSIYLQAAMYFEPFDLPLDVNVGYRYESTDVTSDVSQDEEDFLVWSNPTEWQLRVKPSETGFVTTTGEHTVKLPSIDFKLEVTEDVIARMSWGKTITRAPLGDLAGIRSLSRSPKPGSRNGSSGNTNLLPFESTNLDLSLEYYYNDASYISLGYFKKEVENFISRESSVITVDGLRDPLGELQSGGRNPGPRVVAALAALSAAGNASPTDGEVWQQIIDSGGGVDDACCETQVVYQNSDDPLTEWLVSQPVNGDTKEVDGIEFAVQHMFGETGFGAGFNVTLVDGDVEFDRDDLTPQSPLNGLSDSANLQLFYEKDGLSVKVTYAWRDEYLIGVGQAQGSADAPPQFGKEYAQTDMSINYDVNDELTIFFEAINITDETEQGSGRYDNQFLFARQYGPRYAAGARYTF